MSLPPAPGGRRRAERRGCREVRPGKGHTGVVRRPVVSAPQRPVVEAGQHGVRAARVAGRRSGPSLRPEKLFPWPRPSQSRRRRRRGRYWSRWCGRGCRCPARAGDRRPGVAPSRRCGRVGDDGSQSGPDFAYQDSGCRTTPPPATTPSTARSPLTSRSPVTSGPSGTSTPALNPSPSTVFQRPPVTYAYLTTPTYYYPPPSTTAAPTTSTTIAPIGGHLPVPPSTVPLRTKAQSAHISPVFAALSGAGFLAAFLIMAGRFIPTRPGRKP